MARKKRILWVGDFSQLSTGYATYGREVLSRLHALGRYEIAELASYVAPDDPRIESVPWKVYPVLPRHDRPAEQQAYLSHPANEFGRWKFEETLLDWCPTVTVDVRDPWMQLYQWQSPLRRYFHWLLMPAVDSEPLADQWLGMYAAADGLFGYCDWGLGVLRRQGGARMRILATASPAADPIFRPHPDRAALRQAAGIPADALVVGTVMRNQQRKLYPDLVRAFALLLERAPRRLADRLHLYLHTGWPDLGWDIPRLLREAGVGRRTLLTYHCPDCGNVFPAHFQDARGHCPRCRGSRAVLPTPGSGVSRADLAAVYNLFDAYVQYATCEGFGMPMAEAAACGVPVFAVDYSAMADVVRKTAGYPVRVARMFREHGTHSWRALPDDDDLVGQLLQYLSLPTPCRHRIGMGCRDAARVHFDYDRSAEAWAVAIDGAPEATWDAPPEPHTPSSLPDGLSDADFVVAGLTRVAGRPDLASGPYANALIRDLAWGVTDTGGIYRPFGRPEALERFHQLANERNHWEDQRVRRHHPRG